MQRGERDMSPSVEECLMSSEVVTYELRDHVVWITIDRPEARNALNAAVRTGLLSAFVRFNSDPEAMVAVLSATGDRVFCAGGDLKEMASAVMGVPPSDYLSFVLGDALQIEKPVIAAVNGDAIAGGFLLAMMCDLVVATRDARFSITEARVGRGAPWAASLAWLIPPRVAMELLFTGRPMSAIRAREVGLVNDVVDAPDLRAVVEELALTIAANAPLSVRAAKAMVYQCAGRTKQEARALGDAIFESVYQSQDAIEGPRAFAEGRTPNWSGR
jgi:enoyl-CoA hydratase/carnithine racemase